MKLSMLVVLLIVVGQQKLANLAKRQVWSSCPPFLWPFDTYTISPFYWGKNKKSIEKSIASILNKSFGF